MQKPKRKYFKEKIGMVFRINLHEGTYGYGQIATETKFIFFDHMDVEGHFTPVEEVLKKTNSFLCCSGQICIKRRFVGNIRNLVC